MRLLFIVLVVLMYEDRLKRFPYHHSVFNTEHMLPRTIESLNETLSSKSFYSNTATQAKC